MNLLDEFKYLAVQKGFYKSEARLVFRSKQIFKDIAIQDKNLLEIGCGNGIYSIWARLNGAKSVIGLEPEVDGSTSGSRNLFKEFVEKISIDSIQCLPKTIEEFNPNGMKFDIVLSHMSINHLDEQACINLYKDLPAQEKYLDIFKKIKSLLNPGAKLLILDNSNKNFFGLFKKRSPFCININWTKHQSPEVWVKLLEQAGFSSPKISWPSRYRFLLNLYCPRFISFFLDSFFRIEMELK